MQTSTMYLIAARNESVGLLNLAREHNRARLAGKPLAHIERAFARMVAGCERVETRARHARQDEHIAAVLGARR